MKKLVPVVVLCVVSLSAAATRAATVVSDNFSSNPLTPGSGWSFGIGSNNTSATGPANQFAWNGAGFPTGLTVELNSPSPTARLDHPLGATFSETSNFTVSANFTLSNINAADDQQMEIAFGLTNSSLTGGDRTGTVIGGNYFSTDNTFDTVEFDYFPNLSYGGPFLAPTVFGGQEGGGDAFSNIGFVSNQYFPALDETHNVEYQAQMSYDGATQTLTTTMYQVMAGGALVEIGAGLLTPLSLTDFGFGSTNDGFYDASNPFVVNTLSIMAYNDGTTTSDDPSLSGDITYESIVVATPEPSSLLLALIAGLCAGTAVLRRRLCPPRG